MNGPGPKAAVFSEITGFILLLCLTLAGCAGTDALHPFVGQTGVLVPLENPDGLVNNVHSLTLYLGDAYNDRKDGGQVIFGRRLDTKLRKFLGDQVSSVCRTLPCYLDSARSWHRSFILSARIQRDDDAQHPGGVLTLTRWSVTPFLPQVTVSVPFPLADPPYELILDRGVDRMVRRLDQPVKVRDKDLEKDPASRLGQMVSSGETDRALRYGEGLFLHPSGPPLSKAFFQRLYSLEESAGNSRMADRVGKRALISHMASPLLLSRMAEKARNLGDLNGARNLLFQGVTLYPNDRSFWRSLIRDRIREGRYRKAMTMIRTFDRNNAAPRSRPNFAPEVYAILVETGKGNRADRWFRTYLEEPWRKAVSPSRFLAHARISRYFQRGQWHKAETVLKGLIARGVESDRLYRDLMMALGAQDDPIAEIHAGREAQARGYHSKWIEDQVSYLEQKGY